ncbi:NADH dehydrogenase [ubiquinone] 1 alpha subcomplex subunit 9, mitochondrial-like [Hippocampus zosterae]|uniref:NADH dehydrogenase [ubiquinone] 1 alpha subcomplex subunit 9, mitochondrial-like n=1 Tax=Hippocampus zosterae TaxID=109293 RepID=UPI00223D2B42|nr:NADH dehydrogenase [ubiquinone] 1 alpha subcomplex subunit 9, mitochondrial-like [Hippocampus zosterae]
MLARVVRANFAQLPNKELAFFEYKRKLEFDEYSGLTATIFGATGFMGFYIGKVIGAMGSDIIFPHNHAYIFSDNGMDFDDQDLIERMVKHSDVVINLLGPRCDLKRYEQFEYINIKVAKRLALACKRNERIKRFIHFSAAAAAEDSPSLDFRSKHFGEQEVLSIYPQATILKPCPVFGLNDHFAFSMYNQAHHIYGRNVIFSDLQAVKQPIEVRDVAQAVKNVLRLEESKGKTYYLGGPYQHTMKEIIEIMYNYYYQEPMPLNFPKELATKIATHRFMLPWKYFNHELIVKEDLQEVVPAGALATRDLLIKPASFRQGIAEVQPEARPWKPSLKD